MDEDREEADDEGESGGDEEERVVCWGHGVCACVWT